MDCSSAVELLSDYIDGRVSAEERAALEEHLSRCSSCAVELQRFRLIVGALKELPVLPVPRSFTLSEEQRPRSIFPYLQKATFALAAIFVMMFATSLYIQATSMPQRAQFSAVTSAQPTDAPKASDSLSKAAKPEAPQPQAQVAPERSAPAAGAAPAAPRAAAPLSAQSTNADADSSSAAKKAEGVQSQSSTEEKQNLDRNAATSEAKASSQPLAEVSNNEDGYKWPLLEIEAGVFILLVVVGGAMLIVLRNEKHL